MMSDRLTDAELDQLEALHAAATPAPWDESEFRNRNEIDGPGDVPVLEAGSDGLESSVKFSSHDQALTIAARNALPALLAELRKHRAVEAVHMTALDALVDGDE